MLHSKVRYRIKESYGHDRVAINQLHLAATLSGFQYNYLRFCTDRLGMTFEEKELEGWTMLWRYVGHCIGIQEKALDHFSSFRASEIWWQSMVEGLLVPDESTKELTDHIINSISENLIGVKRMPSRRKLLESAYRVMLPEKMADCLQYEGSFICQWYFKALIYNYGCFLSLERYVKKIPILYNFLGLCWMSYKRIRRIICFVLILIRNRMSLLFGLIKNIRSTKSKKETSVSYTNAKDEVPL